MTRLRFDILCTNYSLNIQRSKFPRIDDEWNNTYLDFHHVGQTLRGGRTFILDKRDMKIRMTVCGLLQRPGEWANEYFCRRVSSPVHGADNIDQKAMTPVASGSAVKGDCPTDATRSYASA